MQLEFPTVKVIAGGDLFASGAQTLVNTVNTVGVMGKGVALGFKERFPDMFDDYRRRCELGQVRLGRPYLWRNAVPPHVLNFPTKAHWRSVSRLQDILAGLEYLREHYEEWGITSLACPPLGCGHGGLEWRVVGPVLYQHLAELQIPVELYAPFGTPHAQLQPTYLRRDLEEVGVADDPEHWQPSRIDPTWVALVAILEELERNPYRSPIGRTSFQKLAYFATAAGLPIGLSFAKGSYGPYADGLKSIQSKLVNNLLVREQPRGKMIAYTVGPTFDAARQAFPGELQRWQPIVKRVADLMSRIQSTREAELAATVHFASEQLAQELGDEPHEQQVLDAVLEWKRRKHLPFSEGDVATAIRLLALKGWLRVKPSEQLPVPELAEVGF